MRRHFSSACLSVCSLCHTSESHDACTRVKCSFMFSVFQLVFSPRLNCSMSVPLDCGRDERGGLAACRAPGRQGHENINVIHHRNGMEVCFES